MLPLTWYPVAAQTVASTQLTEIRLPCTVALSGRGVSTDQLVPFHDSVRRPYPTALHLETEVQETPYSAAPTVGLATVAQFTPSHDSMSGWL